MNLRVEMVSTTLCKRGWGSVRPWGPIPEHPAPATRSGLCRVLHLQPDWPSFLSVLTWTQEYVWCPDESWLKAQAASRSCPIGELGLAPGGQIMDKLKETASKKQMTVSAITDEILYRGLVDDGLMEDWILPGWLFKKPSSPYQDNPPSGLIIRIPEINYLLIYFK